MKKCPQCGNENMDDFKYCGTCGSDLATIIICPYCNAQNNTGNINCINCGKSFNSKVMSQTNPDNNKYSWYDYITLNKLDFKALVLGSISIPLIYYGLNLMISGLYDNYIITYNLSHLLILFSPVLAGIIGMIIFNGNNCEENRPINIFFVTVLSVIMYLIFFSLIGWYGYTFELNILLFTLTIIGTIIGDYIEKNDIL